MKSNNLEELQNLAIDHAKSFTELTTIESLIIRGHILVERSINRSIDLIILNKDEFKAERFTFSQKVILANMLGITTDFKIEINALNKLRNQIAHTLNYDDNLISTIISGINSKKGNIIDFQDDKHKQLGISISFICGAISVAHEGIKAKSLLSLLNKQTFE